MTERSLLDICKEIRQSWTNKNGPAVYFGAVPYLEAMEEAGASGFDKPYDVYYCEDVRTQVIYFLANANTYRGEVAARIKAELRERYGIK